MSLLRIQLVVVLLLLLLTGLIVQALTEVSNSLRCSSDGYGVTPNIPIIALVLVVLLALGIAGVTERLGLLQVIETWLNTPLAARMQKELQ